MTKTTFTINGKVVIIVVLIIAVAWVIVSMFGC